MSRVQEGQRGERGCEWSGCDCREACWHPLLSPGQGPFSASLAPSSAPCLGPSARLPVWLELDLYIETGVYCTCRFLFLRPGAPRRYRKWAGEGGVSEAAGQAWPLSEHLVLTKEGSIFVLKRCDGIRCAEFGSFNNATWTLKEALTCTQSVSPARPRPGFPSLHRGCTACHRSPSPLRWGWKSGERLT